MLDLYKLSKEAAERSNYIFDTLSVKSVLDDFAKQNFHINSILDSNKHILSVAKACQDAIGYSSLAEIADQALNPLSNIPKEVLLGEPILSDAIKISTGEDIKNLISESLAMPTVCSNDLLSNAINSALQSSNGIAEEFDRTLRAASDLLPDSIPLEAETGWQSLLSTLENNNLQRLLGDSFADQANLTNRRLTSALGSEFEHVKVLAQQTRINLIDACEFLPDLGLPDFDSIFDRIGHGSVESIYQDIGQWEHASSLLAETARAFAEVPLNIREQWIRDFEDIDTENLDEPITATEVSESLENEAENIRKRKIPKLFLKLLKNPKTYYAIVGLLYTNGLVINIDNSTTVYNIQPQINFNFSESQSTDFHDLTFGKIKTNDPTSSVRLRRGPGLNFSSKVKYIPNKTQVVVLTTKKQWAKVSLTLDDEPLDGWIALKHIEFSAPRRAIH
ncbi:MAG: hypothetical protein R3E90_13445 [Marinicella sp.]